MRFRSSVSSAARIAGLVLLLTLASAAPALAQAVTTSSLNGRVISTEGQPLQNVRVTLTNIQLGTRQTVLTREDGRFNFSGLRPGGPYRLDAEGLGYAGEALDNLFLALGETERVDFVLSAQAIALEGLEIAGERTGAIISRGRTGTGTVLNEQVVTSTPTISRNFTDFVRLTPQVTAATPGTSAAGRNNRYNNIQIDGAVNNDLFGLAASGTPGGQADARPITLEAIQEFQVNLAPFDVRQGGFTGANINAVTRGGTNDLRGTLAWFGRNESLIGQFNDLQGNRSPEVADFDQSDLAFSLGGPIVRDRAHFFVAGELSRRTEPYSAQVGVNTGSPAGSITAADIAEIDSIVRARYDYDPGAAGPFARSTDSNNLFARLDVQVAPEHRLTLRHNWVDALQDNSTGGAGATFGYSNSGYGFNSITNSTVAQLNSNVGAGIDNEFRVGFTTVRDSRDIGTPFPRFRIDLGGPNNVRVGPDEFSGQNALDQDILEITNDLTLSRGNHTITVGTSNEFFQFSNLFVRNAFGNWRFGSMEAFRNQTPNTYEYSFLLPGGNERAEFPVRRWSLYAQDRWEASRDLVLTYGVRMDLTQLPDTPARNPVLAAANLGRNTDEVPSSALQVNPRVGFNWDVYGDRSTQLRGGLGLFSGRTPFVWISNAYGNTGIDYVRFTCRNAEVPTFSADPASQPTACAGGDAAFAPNEINTVDPDYRFPQVFRASAAVDRELGVGGLVGTLEGLYTSTLQDIRYQNLLIEEDPGAGTVEGRPQFRVNRLQAGDGEIPVGEVIDITNTSEGYSWNLTAQLQRPIRDGWGLNAAYTLSEAQDVNRGGSSQAISNWRFNPTAGDPNDLPAARSNFLIRHRILASTTREVALSDRFPTLVSLVWVSESGQPYTYVYSGDLNGDGQTSNDLIWVPASQDEIRFRATSDASAAQSWQNLDAYIDSTPCLRGARGSILERGACSEPWHHQLDLRLSQEVRTFGTQRAEVTLDILNVGNLVNRDWGRKEFVGNESFNLLEVASASQRGDEPAVVNGRALMNPFGSRETSTSISNLVSRYQIQLGVRYSF